MALRFDALSGELHGMGDLPLLGTLPQWRSHQGNFYRWLAVASAGVSVMILADSLAVLGIAWLVVSLAVHRLLLHFPDRPNAHRACMDEVRSGRIGDISLLIAIVLCSFIWERFGSRTYSSFGTIRFWSNLYGCKLSPSC